MNARFGLLEFSSPLLRESLVLRQIMFSPGSLEDLINVVLGTSFPVCVFTSLLSKHEIEHQKNDLQQKVKTEHCSPWPTSEFDKPTPKSPSIRATKLQFANRQCHVNVNGLG